MSIIKTLVVGCGGISNRWITYLKERPDVTIEGLVDLREKAALEKKEKHQLSCPVYTDLKKALAESKAELVCNCTIPEAHYPVVQTALETGCAVFGEKPLAVDMDQAQKLVALARKSGRTYSVMQNRRYMKTMMALQECVQSGIIGQPGFFCCDFFIGFHDHGFRETMENPLLLDMAIHTFDQARFISGADAVSVYCREFNLPGSWYKGGASVVCIFEMSDHSVFCYRGSWSADGCPTPWEGNWRVVGSKGTAVCEYDHEPFAEVMTSVADPQSMCSPVKRMELTKSYSGRLAHQGCMDEMFYALIEGRKSQTDCADNIKSLAMVHAAVKSARLGEKVTVNLTHD